MKKKRLDVNKNQDQEQKLMFKAETNYYYYRVLRAICCQPVDGSLICFM